MYKIEYGYDRKIKSYNTVLINEDGDIVESIYSGNLKDCLYEIECLKNTYNKDNIESITKIKAY